MITPEVWAGLPTLDDVGHRTQAEVEVGRAVLCTCQTDICSKFCIYAVGFSIKRKPPKRRHSKLLSRLIAVTGFGGLSLDFQYDLFRLTGCFVDDDQMTIVIAAQLLVCVQ
jgi:hypothetical protein